MSVSGSPVDWSGYPGLLSAGPSQPTLLMTLTGLCGRGCVTMPAVMPGGGIGGRMLTPAVTAGRSITRRFSAFGPKKACVWW